jgi:hypothetical protein
VLTGVSPLRKARPTPDEPATNTIKKGGSPHGTLEGSLPPLQTTSPALLPIAPPQSSPTAAASSPPPFLHHPTFLMASGPQPPNTPPPQLRVLSPSGSNGTSGPNGSTPTHGGGGSSSSSAASSASSTPTNAANTPTNGSSVMFHRKNRGSDAPKPLFQLNTNGSDTASASPPSPITPLGAAANSSRPFPPSSPSAPSAPTTSSSPNGLVSPLTAVVGDVPLGDANNVAARPSLSSARFHGRQTSSRSLLGGAAPAAGDTAASTSSTSTSMSTSSGTGSRGSIGNASRLPSSGAPVNTSTPTAAPPSILRQLSSGSPLSPTGSSSITTSSFLAGGSAPQSSPGRVTVHARPLVTRAASISGGTNSSTTSSAAGSGTSSPSLNGGRSSPPSPSSSPLSDALIGEGTLDLAQMPVLSDVLSQEAALLVAATRAPSQSDPPLPRRNSFGGRSSVMVHSSRSMAGSDFDFLNDLQLAPVPSIRRSIAFRPSISLHTRQSFAVGAARRCCFAGCDNPNDGNHSLIPPSLACCADWYGLLIADRAQPYCVKHRLPQDNKKSAKAALSTIPSVASTPGGSPLPSAPSSPGVTPRPSISAGKNGPSVGFAVITPAVAAAPLIGAPMVTSARFLSEEEIGVRRAVRKQTAVLAKPTLTKLRADALTEFAFIKSVLDVMDTPDDLARGLAVRVLWMSLSTKAKEAPLPSLRPAPAPVGSVPIGTSASVAASLAAPKAKESKEATAAALALEPQWRGTVNELGQHFGSYVQLYGSGSQSNRYVINSLFTVLVRDQKEFTLDVIISLLYYPPHRHLQYT